MNSSSLAGHTIELLDRVVKSSLPMDRVVQDFYREKRYLGSHDRRWINEKLYGIARNFILLRSLSGDCANGAKPLPVFLAHEIVVVRLEPDELAKEYGQLLDAYKMSGERLELEELATCFKNRLRELDERSARSPAVYSFPDFFPELLAEDVRGEAIPMMVALNHEARVCVRVDTNRIQRAEAAKVLEERGIETQQSRYSPMGLYLLKRTNLNNERLYKEGLIEIQEEASQLVGLLANPQKEEIIVDACAGAGGKSLEMASLSGGQSRIYALDVDEARLRNLGARANRGGYTNISRVKVSDDNLGEASSLTGLADKVIVDAPCTGSGTIRRNPDKKFRLTRSLVERQATYQRTLLDRYSDLVRVGGLFVYSTCSIFSAENFQVVESFLASDDRFRLDDVSHYLTGPEFSELTESGFLVIYPHRHDMDGFFTAVMRRVK